MEFCPSVVFSRETLETVLTCLSAQVTLTFSLIKIYFVCLLQLQLQTELLKMEKRSADVTHTFHLSECFNRLTNWNILVFFSGEASRWDSGVPKCLNELKNIRFKIGVIFSDVTSCRLLSCSSEVPHVAEVLWSPAGPPEGSEQSEAEADETSGPNQPACSGSPAQVTLVC